MHTFLHSYELNKYITNRRRKTSCHPHLRTISRHIPGSVMQHSASLYQYAFSFLRSFIPTRHKCTPVLQYTAAPSYLHTHTSSQERALISGCQYQLQRVSVMDAVRCEPQVAANCSNDYTPGYHVPSHTSITPPGPAQPHAAATGISWQDCFKSLQSFCLIIVTLSVAVVAVLKNQEGNKNLWIYETLKKTSKSGMGRVFSFQYVYYGTHINYSSVSTTPVIDETCHNRVWWNTGMKYTFFSYRLESVIFMRSHPIYCTSSTNLE